MSPLPITLYDTYLKEKIILNPSETVHPETLTLYSCGPTIYNYQHIGNVDAVYLPDMIKRIARLCNWSVRWASNITDVGHLVGDGDEGEDKLENGAKRENKQVAEIVEFYTQDFLRQLSAVNIEFPQGKLRPKATEYIREQMLLSLRLLQVDLAYVTEVGIYIDTPKVREILLAHRIENPQLESILHKLSVIDSQNKDFNDREILSKAHHVTDFILWKFVDPNSLQKWKFSQFPEVIRLFNEIQPPNDVPYSYEQLIELWGCPGWHSECVCMISEVLGNKRFSLTSRSDSSYEIDIHTGGEDHIDIHHQNEIIQSEALGFHLSKHWVHNKFVLVDDEKMSKSKGNVYTVLGSKAETGFESILQRGFDPLAYRLMLMETDYTHQLNFTWEKLEQAQQRLYGLRKNCSLIYSYYLTIRSGSWKDYELLQAHPKQVRHYADILRDNLATYKALEKFQQLVEETVDGITSRQELNMQNLGLIRTLEQEIFDLNLIPNVSEEIQQLLQQRIEAKAQKNYQQADALREQIVALGWQVADYSWGSWVYSTGRKN